MSPSSLQTQAFLDCAGHTSGVRRPEHKPDRFLVGHLNRSLLVSHSNTVLGSRTRVSGGSVAHVLAVAEGLGDERTGAAAAAEAATDALARQLVDGLASAPEMDPLVHDEVRAGLRQLVERCQGSVQEVGRRSRQDDVGSTLTAAYLLWPRLYLLHLGDCRAYLVRDGALRRLTTDHLRVTAPSQLPADALPEPAGRRRARVTRALGQDEDRARPELQRLELQPGDSLVLVTSSLMQGVEEAELLDRVERAPSAEHASQDLTRTAVARNHDHEATAIVARFRRPHAAGTPGAHPSRTSSSLDTAS